MQTYILRGKWDSTRRAKDIDHLRKWLASLYSGVENPKIDVYVVTNGKKRFVGKFGKYNGKPVWYTKSYTTINDFRLINKKNGTLI